MNSFRVHILCVAFFSVFTATHVPAKTLPSHVPGELLVTVEKGSPFPPAGAPSRGMIRLAPVHGERGTFLVKLGRDVPIEEAIDFYKNVPGVVSVQPNYIYRPAYLPSDPYYPWQWGHEKVSAPEAWDMTLGDQDVVIAVIDTGVAYDHPDLAGALWHNPGEIPENGVDDDGNGFVDDTIGWDFFDWDLDPWDPHGHGTHVAGIIAASMDNGEGITGLAPGCRIMALKTGGISGYFTTSTLVGAIDYAASMGAKIINASWGGYDYDSLLKESLRNAGDRGVLVVSAAGNDSSNNDQKPFYPASYDLPNIISVAASDENENLAWFSNFGNANVDVAAPGVDIWSTYIGNRKDIVSYSFESGTLEGWTTGGTGDTWGIESGEGHGNSLYFLSDSTEREYENGARSYAMVNLDLSGEKGAVLEGYAKGISLANDNLYVQTSKDVTFWKGKTIELLDLPLIVPFFTGDRSDGWYHFRVDMGDLDGKSGYLRFLLETDGSGSADGWKLDDISIKTAGTITGDTLVSMNGTSMATPLVSATAALIFSAKGTISHLDVKSLIMLGCDQVPALAGKVACGGRVNVLNSLNEETTPAQSTPQGGGGGGSGCRVNGGGEGAGAFLPVALAIFLLSVYCYRYRKKKK